MRINNLYRYAEIVDAGDAGVILKCIEDNGSRGLFVHENSTMKIKPNFVIYFADLVEIK